MRTILIVIALFAFMLYTIDMGLEKEEDRWCDNHRYLVETTPQQWTQNLQDICGEF